MRARFNPIQKHLRSETVRRAAKNFLGLEHFSWIAMGLVAVFFLAAGWIPDGVTNLVLPGGNTSHGIAQFAGSALIFTVLGFIVSHQIEKVQKIRVQVGVPEAARVLVVFLSTIGRNPHEQTILRRLEEGEVPAGVDAMATPWEMPLTAIAHHHSRLQQLVVVTSQQDGGSHAQHPAFCRLLAATFPSHGFQVVELTADGLNFEDLAAVHALIDGWYSRESTRNYVHPHDIIIDLTGGQKPASIAAAMATLADGRRFQYVSTTDKAVRAFDLVVGD